LPFLGVFQQALHELKLVPHPADRAREIVDLTLQHGDALLEQLDGAVPRFPAAVHPAGD